MNDSWRELAACKDADPSLFFAPERPSVHDPVTFTYGQARQVCRACPVARACLEDALATEAGTKRYGMRGGMTPSERNRFARAGHTVYRRRCAWCRVEFTTENRQIVCCSGAHTEAWRAEQKRASRARESQRRAS